MVDIWTFLTCCSSDASDDAFWPALAALVLTAIHKSQC